MAARLHIIATPVGGIPEVLQTYPYKTFIRGFTPPEICDSILGAITALGKRSLEQQPEPSVCLKDFDWQRIARQVEEVYRSACA
jgi:glycosyltransferase involved in cell wall biosynthesis